MANRRFACAGAIGNQTRKPRSNATDRRTHPTGERQVGPFIRAAPEGGSLLSSNSLSIIILNAPSGTHLSRPSTARIEVFLEWFIASQALFNRFCFCGFDRDGDRSRPVYSRSCLDGESSYRSGSRDGRQTACSLRINAYERQSDTGYTPENRSRGCLQSFAHRCCLRGKQSPIATTNIGQDSSRQCEY